MELINKLQNKDLYKVAIIDDDICDEKLKTKLTKLGFNDILSNTIAKEIRTIEICEELLKRQALKLEKQTTNLPLIVTDDIDIKDSLRPYLTKIMSVDEIMIELLKYGNALPTDLTSDMILMVFINDNKPVENSSLIYYLSPSDLEELDIESDNVVDNIITNNIYTFGITETNYTSILTTYQEIMKPSYKYNIVVKDDNTIIVESKKQLFKVLMVNDFNNLDESILNDYQLIIPKQSDDLLFPSVLKEPNVNDIYRYCYTQPGRHFNRGK